MFFCPTDLQVCNSCNIMPKAREIYILCDMFLIVSCVGSKPCKPVSGNSCAAVVISSADYIAYLVAYKRERFAFKIAN